MSSRRCAWLARTAACLLAVSGCSTPPTRSDEGAVIGGLGGAGLGAVVGHAVGNTGAGALIGAGVGALSGAAVGGSLDEIEARNRAEIEARLGRPAPGAVTVNDVVGMTHAGVSEDVIVTHVQTHGVAAPLAPNDLIVLGQQGVSSRVIQAMQVPPVAAAPVVMQPYPPPPPGYWGPPPYPYYYRPYPRPAVSWGISVGR